MSQYQGRARMDIWKLGTLIKTRSGALGSRSRRENRRDESPRTTRAPLCAAPRTLNKHLKQRKFIHSTPCLLDSLLQPLQERGPLMIGRILTQPDGAQWPRAAFAGRGSGGTVRSWDAASGRLRGTYPGGSRYLAFDSRRLHDFSSPFSELARTAANCSESGPLPAAIGCRIAELRGPRAIRSFEISAHVRSQCSPRL